MSSTFSTLSAATTAQELSDGFVAIAIAAGRLILEIYDTDFDVETKSDKSPVTEADQRAETLILAGLQKLCPTVPVVAEEEAAAKNAEEEAAAKKADEESAAKKAEEEAAAKKAEEEAVAGSALKPLGIENRMVRPGQTVEQQHTA